MRHSWPDDHLAIASDLTAKATQPIGIFDSGVGGLSVLRHIQRYLPHEHLIYFADQAHVPYGSRSLSEIRQFSAEITRFLLSQGAKIIVAACNTASAAALTVLRASFPSVPFVGMEPAVKPAALNTRSGKVGVLATVNTFASPRYEQLMHRFARDVQIFEDPCHGLVPLIEAGHFSDPETEQLLRSVLSPMVASGIDTLVLGCTHYPFVQPLIESLLASDFHSEQITIIDPAPAVARQTANVLSSMQLLAPPPQTGSTLLFTSARLPLLQPLARKILEQEFEVREAVWHESRLHSA